MPGIIADQDILASDLYHIRKLITTASQDLTAGQAVGASLLGSGVAKALTHSSLSSVQTTFADTQTGANSTIAVTPISGDKFVIVYEMTNTTLRAVVATVNRSTMAITLGTAVTLTADSYKVEDDTIDICTIDTDKFVVGYVSNADKTITKAVVCTVSGTVITVGTPQTIKDYASGTMSVIAICKLDTNKFAYYNTTSTTNQEVFACTVSGTVITVGTAVACGANIIDQVHSAQLATDKFILFSSNGYLQVCTVSGTTITAGTQQNSSMSGLTTVGGYDIFSHTSNAFVLRSTSHVMAGTVSGTVITFGTQVACAGQQGGFVAVDSTNVRLFTINSGAIYNIAISGTVITLTQKSNEKFSLGVNSYSTRKGASTSGNGYFVLIRANGSNGIEFFIEGMSIQFIGFAQTSVSRGADVEVVMGGADAHQSALTAGETYVVGYGGVLALQTADESNIIPSEVHIIKAISATEVVF